MAKPRKKVPKQIVATKHQLAEGVAVPTGCKVKLVLVKKKFSFSG